MNDEARTKLASYNPDAESFINNYRTALEEQYNADVAALNNQRNLDYTSIMSNANTRGMLHSNFPTREKLKYDVSTYEPGLVKARQGYQTGLDTLYGNVAKYYNQIKQIQDNIASLNSGGDGTSTSTGANAEYTSEHGYQFTDDQGSPITYAEYAKRKGGDTGYNLLKEMAANGDFNATRAIAGLQNADRLLTAEERRAFQILGLPTTGYGSRQ